MRLIRPITVAGVLLLAQLPALGAEVAVLRNGFSIHFERKEQTGNVTRLYTGTGYVDIASDQIASFETEEAPVPAPADPAAASPSAGTPAAAAKPVQPIAVPPKASTPTTSAATKSFDTNHQ